MLINQSDIKLMLKLRKQNRQNVPVMSRQFFLVTFYEMYLVFFLSTQEDEHLSIIHSCK